MATPIASPDVHEADGRGEAAADEEERADAEERRSQ